jgi:hypothetical protein
MEWAAFRFTEWVGLIHRQGRTFTPPPKFPQQVLCYNFVTEAIWSWRGFSKCS